MWGQEIEEELFRVAEEEVEESSDGWIDYDSARETMTASERDQMRIERSERVLASIERLKHGESSEEEEWDGEQVGKQANVSGISLNVREPIHNERD